jgi:hypothetical protein
MSAKSKTEILEAEVKNISKDISSIVKEHQNYVLEGEDADNFFSAFSFPIETLKESLERQRGLTKKKYSLKDFYQKIKLRKLHQKSIEKLSFAKSELMVSKIDELLIKCKEFL